ncbi:MAG: FixH family protein [Rhodospirillales bacterium]|jgi:hypothetical protein|nr:FixH family protein [Rhodospirillales bacterium]
MSRILGAVFLAATLAFILAVDGRAAAKDYVFEAVTATVPPGNDVLISVRLVNRTTGQPVPNAVIFQTRLDMSPDRMADMAAPVTPLAASEPGIYRFKVDLEMPGRWAFKLAAKVPGEPETVRGEVLIVAAK